MEYFPLILLSFFLLALVTRLLTVLIHEMGHAIPAILLTKQKVIVYIGSYGDPAGSLKIEIGLLEVWLRCNPLLWNRGLCIPTTDDISINKRIIYTLSGPVASFAISLLACYFTFSFDLHGSLKLIFIVLLGSSVFDLVYNMVPRNIPIRLYDNTVAYNDGRQLRELFRYKRFPNEYLKAIAHYNKKEYEKAVALIDDFLCRRLDMADIYRLGISSCTMLQRYDQALMLHTTFTENHQLTSDDYCMSGLIRGHLLMYDTCLADFKRSLEINPNNVYTLNNRGYVLNIWERYDEAMQDFDLAISLNPDFAYPYNNRGLAKIKMGGFDEGLQNILMSLQIDSDNSYAYRNLGIYHMERGDKSAAFELFSKAKTLDASTHSIDELIKQVS